MIHTNCHALPTLSQRGYIHCQCETAASRLYKMAPSRLNQDLIMLLLNYVCIWNSILSLTFKIDIVYALSK
jgi:hypothetical protein